MKYVLAILLLTLTAYCFADFTDAEKDQLVKYTQETFQLMYDGNTSAIARLDWTNLRVLDENYGATYDTLKTDEERTSFQTNTLLAFQGDFAEFEVDPPTMENWTFESGADTGFEVDADGNDYLFWFDFTKVGDHYLLNSVDYEDTIDY